MSQYKIATIFLSTLVFTMSSYAATVTRVEGDAPKSPACQAIQASNQSFSMMLIMPNSQYKSAKIETTQGFAFQYPYLVAFNNEGVKGACDYYLNPTEITVNGKTRTLQRLLINSVYQANQFACTNVTVYMSIAAPNGSSCDIQMN